MIPAEKTSKRKDQESHILKERHQLPINKSELPPIDGIGHSGSLSIRYQWEHKDRGVNYDQMIGQDHILNWELKRGADIEGFIEISSYRGIRHQDGLPLRGHRTHTNAMTCRKRIRK